LDIIFDIDGCLADCSKRKHHLVKEPKDWKSFYAGIIHDEPILEMIHVLQTMYGPTPVNRIILVTGRSMSYMSDTKMWLEKNHIRYDALYMRKKGDNRDDDIIKLELLTELRGDGYDPKLVFEDRTRVVDMWRAQGLICCQTAWGDF
jgi:hypothetical protein